MSWGQRESDGLFGVLDWPSLSEIYLKNHNDLVGETWQRHLVEFSNTVAKYAQGDVLEIGSGHGLLGQTVLRAGGKFRSWSTIEPNPLSTNSLGREINGWFPQDLPEDLTPTMLVHSHVFEHQESPLNFAMACWHALPPDGLVVMSLPNMDEMARNCDFNMLMFEHTTFLPHKEVLNVMNFAGFELTEKVNFEGHSYFFVFRKVQLAYSGTFKSIVTADEFSAIAKAFRHELASFTKAANSLICFSERPAFIFGAHIFAQYLAATGLAVDRLTACVDNNPNKWGERLYGSSLTVIGPHELPEKVPINILVPLASYEREVCGQLEKMLFSGSNILGVRGGLSVVV